jgi:hypothetical protein
VSILWVVHCKTWLVKPNSSIIGRLLESVSVELVRLDFIRQWILKLETCDSELSSLNSSDGSSLHSSTTWYLCLYPKYVPVGGVNNYFYVCMCTSQASFRTLGINFFCSQLLNATATDINVRGLLPQGPLYFGTTTDHSALLAGMHYWTLPGQQCCHLPYIVWASSMHCLGFFHALFGQIVNSLP